MKRVLIVDDAIDLGRLLQDTLKAVYPDIPTTVVPSAEEALLETTRYKIDLLVTDIRLPGMSGMELVRKIRNRQPQIKIMLISGMVMDEALRKQRDEINADAFLPKPLMPQVFLDTVDRLLADAPQEEPQREVPAETKVAKVSDQAAQETQLADLAGVLPGEPVEKKPAGKKQTGRLVMPSAAAEPHEEGFSGLLSYLRNTLGAVCALLLDERGHPVAQAGDIPNQELHNQITSSIMAALSAGSKISYLLGQPVAQTVQACRGVDLEFVFAPVGTYTLLVALKTGRSAVRLAIAFEEVLAAQADLIAIMEKMGLRVQLAVEAAAPESVVELAAGPEKEELTPELLDTPLGQDQSLEKFEELFARKKTGQLRMEDPDAFWDTVSSDEKHDISTPGVLTYEQAQKLGLLPSDKQG